MTGGLFALVTAVVATVATGGASLIVLDRHARTTLRTTTLADLLECPLRRLYLLALVAMRARLRESRRGLSPPIRCLLALVHAKAALETLAFAFVPTDPHRRARIERMWLSAILHLDGVIDADLRPSRGTREE